MTLFAFDLGASQVGLLARALPATILTMIVWGCSSSTAPGDAVHDGAGGTTGVPVTGGGGNDADAEALRQDAAAAQGSGGQDGSAGEDAAGPQGGGAGQSGARRDADADRLCPPFPKFPDESCTGVPAGYALTTVTGDLTTTTDGQVIDGKEIAGNLVVKHKRVTVTRSRVKGRVDASDNTGSETRPLLL